MSPELGTLELILLGGLVLLLLFWFVPGIRHALTHSPRGTVQDWLGLAFPIGLVVLFVLLLLLAA